MTNRYLEKRIEKTGIAHYKRDRFLAGLLLGRIYTQLDKGALVEFMMGCGLDTFAIAEILTYMEHGTGKWNRIDESESIKAETQPGRDR